MSFKMSEDGFCYVELGNNVAITSYQGHAKDLVIPPTIDGKKVVSLYNEVFQVCSELETLVIPDYVREVAGRLFIYCNNLKRVVFPNHMDKIEPEMFYGCDALEEFTVPDNALLTLPVAVSCPNLKRYIISSDSRFYSGMNGAVYSRNYKMLVAYPAGLTFPTIVIPDEVEEICECAFMDNVHIQRVIFGKNVKRITDGAFRACKGLEAAEINTGTESLGSRAFAQCSSLSSIKLPEGLNEIGEHCFTKSGLCEIYLPKSLKNVGAGLFSGCASLRDIRYSGSESDWSKINFVDDSPIPEGAVVHFDRA